MKKISKKSRTTLSEVSGRVTNDVVQRMLKREVRAVRRRGWKIWFMPYIMWFDPPIRAMLRENPDLIPDFVENYRRLEHDF